MNRVSTKVATLSIVLCLVLCFGSAAASQTTASNSQATSASAASKNAKSQSGTPSASDIAAAKASGKVWVNLDSGVYHKGGRWYGKTKNGKFMTVDEAKKAGYKAAKRD
jgi:hypothetical protein